MTSKENPGGKDQGIQETGVESLSQCDTIGTKYQVNFDADVFNSCLDAALFYAEKGLPVFPCNASNKRPMTPNGFKDASTDPATIKIWWENNPDAAIGIPTGEISGLVVVDIDDYKDDFDQVAWDAIC
ncbi:MAG: bifunctional DNA primase/polymerase, partial [Desulfotignum sp.]